MRYCFQPRDRAREQARRTIQKRIEQGTSASISETENRNIDEKDIVDLLERIIVNDRSFFSIQNLEKSRNLLSSPFPMEPIWMEQDAETLRGEEKLVSWYGFDGAKSLKEYLKGLESLTPLDYSIIFQRYHIVGSLILGGINPCIHGLYQGENGTHDEWHQTLCATGCFTLQRFFDGVPLTLSSYIAKRSFDLRYAYWKHGLEKDTCDLCGQAQVPRSLRLSFATSCPHVVCELCYWKSTLDRLDQTEGDVVACPSCYPIMSQQGKSNGAPIDEGLRRQRLERTRSKFYKLPKDGNDLKRTAGKPKRTKNTRFILSSTWSDAVKPFLGSSQESRTDRFFSFVESGALNRVRGCLEAGIDLDLMNQYGQTALYVAAWRGRAKVARLLLENGANPNGLANGRTLPSDAAAKSGFVDLVDLLHQYGGSRAIGDVECLHLPTRDLEVKEIIPLSMEHPGAGSYTIDGLLDESCTQSLIQLWNSLPVAEGKQKAGPCSERRYYCDITGFVTCLLNSVMGAVNDQMQGGITFLPFMRFLCYSESGTILAPHVDLSRVDVDSGQQSTHTFILYLTDCNQGGATSLIHSLSGPGRHEKLAVVRPVRGRLLLFPHFCPHEGEAVVDVPKLLIRGEAILPECGLLQI